MVLPSRVTASMQGCWVHPERFENGTVQGQLQVELTQVSEWWEKVMNISSAGTQQGEVYNYLGRGTLSIRASSQITLKLRYADMNPI